MSVIRLGIEHGPEPPKPLELNEEQLKDEAFIQHTYERLKQGRFVMTDEERELYRSHLKTGVPEPRD